MRTIKIEKPEYVQRGRTKWLVLPDAEGVPLDLKKGTHLKDKVNNKRTVVDDNKTPQIKFRERRVAGDRRR